jgi:hypothetical protein
MKRWVVGVSLAVLIAAPTVASAQYGDDYRSDLRYQIKGGFVATYLTSNNYQDTGAGYGWAAGVGLYLPLFSRHFGAQIEALYVDKQADAFISEETINNRRASDPDFQLMPAVGDEYRIDIQSVEIPLMGQLAFANEPNFRGYILGGGNFDIRAQAKVKYVDKATREDVDLDIEDATTLDWQPIIGLGLQSQNFLLEIRFLFGTRDVGGEQSQSETKITTNQILFGLSF